MPHRLEEIEPVGPVGGAGPVQGMLPTLDVNDMRPHIEKLFAFLTGGEFPLKEDVAKLIGAGEINLKLRPSGDKILVEIQAPAILLDVQYGLHFRKRIQGVTVGTDKITIEIEKFPDFEINVLS